jgi:hypothetical protein
MTAEQCGQVAGLAQSPAVVASLGRTHHKCNHLRYSRLVVCGAGPRPTTNHPNSRVPQALRRSLESTSSVRRQVRLIFRWPSTPVFAIIAPASALSRTPKLDFDLVRSPVHLEDCSNAMVAARRTGRNVAGAACRWWRLRRTSGSAAVRAALARVTAAESGWGWVSAAMSSASISKDARDSRSREDN